MTARTFGRKGMAAIAPPPVDEAALRRAAFLAEERARCERPDASEAPHAAPAPHPDKSLPAAYLMWLFMGSFGAHRFYLGRPLTAALMVCLWATGWALVFRENYAGFTGVLAVGWWVFVDGFLIRRMHRIATTRSA